MSLITAAPVTPVGSVYNTTPAYSGSFIPTLWSAKLNAKFYAASTFVDICNHDWEGEISEIGDKVIINNIPDIVIKDYVAGANLSYDTPKPNTLEMSVDRGKYFAFNVNDVLAMQSKPALMDMFSADAAQQMKVTMDATCLYRTLLSGDVSASNRGSNAGKRSFGFDLGIDTAPVTLLVSNVLQKILEMAAVLDEQNVPESGRWLLIDPLTRTLLLQSNLGQAQITGDDKSIVRNGLIGLIDRFKVYVTNQLPYKAAGASVWTSGNADEASIFGGSHGVRARVLAAGHTSGLSFAAQMSKTETLRNPTDFGDLVRGLQIFGHKVTKGDSVVAAIVK